MKTKKVKGFTLIELIVVIAIIGVLAAILVPTLMTWTRKSKVGSANTTAKTIYTTAQAAAQDAETAGAAGGASIQIVPRAAAKTGALEKADNVSVWVQTEIENGVQGLKADTKYAVGLNGYIVTATVFSANGSTLTGAYPNPVNTKIDISYAGDSSQIANASAKTSVTSWN